MNPTASTLTYRISLKLVLLIILALVLSWNVYRPQPAQALALDWTQVWMDDFNSLSGDWYTLNGAVTINHEQEAYQSNTVGTWYDPSIGSSTLSLGAFTAAQMSNSYGKPYTAGAVQSRIMLTRGTKVEFRAKLPSGTGIWPALWLVSEACDGKNGCGAAWPPEIDVMELKGQDPYTVYQTHWWGSFTEGGWWSCPNARPGNGTYCSHTTSVNNGTNWSAGYHVYGVQWLGDRIDFFVDYSYAGTHWNYVTEAAPNRMRIEMNVAVGGDFVGQTICNCLPVYMNVDWVKLYAQFNPNASYRLSPTNQGGKALDVTNRSTADNQQLQVWDWAAADNQRWKIEYLPYEGHYKITSRFNGKAVTNSGSCNSCWVAQYGWANWTSQHWRMELVTDNVWKILNRANGKAIDIETGTNRWAHQWDYVGGGNQKWYIYQN